MSTSQQQVYMKRRWRILVFVATILPSSYISDGCSAFTTYPNNIVYHSRCNLNLQFQAHHYHDHDYQQASNSGSLPSNSKLTEEQIHELISKRIQYKRQRNYTDADKILTALNTCGALHLSGLHEAGSANLIHYRGWQIKSSSDSRGSFSPF